MAQWGRNNHGVTANSSTTAESSNGAPIGTYVLVKGDQVNRVNGANACDSDWLLNDVLKREQRDFNVRRNSAFGRPEYQLKRELEERLMTLRGVAARN